MRCSHNGVLIVVECLPVPPLFRQLQRVLDASCSEPAADAVTLVGGFKALQMSAFGDLRFGYSAHSVTCDPLRADTAIRFGK